MICLSFRIALIFALLAHPALPAAPGHCLAPASTAVSLDLEPEQFESPLFRVLTTRQRRKKIIRVLALFYQAALEVGRLDQRKRGFEARRRAVYKKLSRKYRKILQDFSSSGITDFEIRKLIEVLLNIVNHRSIHEDMPFLLTHIGANRPGLSETAVLSPGRTLRLPRLTASTTVTITNSAFSISTLNDLVSETNTRKVIEEMGSFFWNLFAPSPYVHFFKHQGDKGSSWFISGLDAFDSGKTPADGWTWTQPREELRGLSLFHFLYLEGWKELKKNLLVTPEDPLARPHFDFERMNRLLQRTGIHLKKLYPGKSRERAMDLFFSKFSDPLMERIRKIRFSPDPAQDRFLKETVFRELKENMVSHTFWHNSVYTRLRLILERSERIARLDLPSREGAAVQKRLRSLFLETLQYERGRLEKLIASVRKTMASHDPQSDVYQNHNYHVLILEDILAKHVDPMIEQSRAELPAVETFYRDGRFLPYKSMDVILSAFLKFESRKTGDPLPYLSDWQRKVPPFIVYRHLRGEEFEGKPWSPQAALRRLENRLHRSARLGKTGSKIADLSRWLNDALSPLLDAPAYADPEALDPEIRLLLRTVRESVRDYLHADFILPGFFALTAAEALKYPRRSAPLLLKDFFNDLDNRVVYEGEVHDFTIVPSITGDEHRVLFETANTDGERGVYLFSFDFRQFKGFYESLVEWLGLDMQNAVYHRLNENLEKILRIELARKTADPAHILERMVRDVWKGVSIPLNAMRLEPGHAGYATHKRKILRELERMREILETDRERIRRYLDLPVSSRPPLLDLSFYNSRDQVYPEDSDTVESLLYENDERLERLNDLIARIDADAAPDRWALRSDDFIFERLIKIGKHEGIETRVPTGYYTNINVVAAGIRVFTAAELETLSLDETCTKIVEMWQRLDEAVNKIKKLFLADSFEFFRGGRFSDAPLCRQARKQRERAAPFRRRVVNVYNAEWIFRKLKSAGTSPLPERESQIRERIAACLSCLLHSDRPLRVWGETLPVFSAERVTRNRMEWIWKNWLDLGESFTLERLESWLNEASLERRARENAPGRTSA